MLRSTHGGKAPAGRPSFAPRRQTTSVAPLLKVHLCLVISCWHFVEVNWRDRKETHVGWTSMLCWEPRAARQGPAPRRPAVPRFNSVGWGIETGALSAPGQSCTAGCATPWVCCVWAHGFYSRWGLFRERSECETHRETRGCDALVLALSLLGCRGWLLLTANPLRRPSKSAACGRWWDWQSGDTETFEHFGRCITSHCVQQVGWVQCDEHLAPSEGIRFARACRRIL